VGRPNNGLIGVWPRANDQGAWEIGLQPLENLQAAFDRAAAVYIVGADPIGDGTLKLRSGRRRPYIVVQDLFESETAKIADAVLPAQSYMEREGTFTSGERRVQRFYPAVPSPDGPKPDFAITSQLARQMGVILEGTSASVVFEIMSAEEESSFARLNYAHLSEVREQWPIVGRGDVYYGGTTYENKQGLGVQLFSAAQRGKKVSVPRARKTATLRPKEKQLLAVPVTKLYDRARSVSSAPLLERRIGEPFVALHPTAAARFGAVAGQRVTLSLNGAKEEAVVKIDPSISTGVALIPRSMGLPIRAPKPIRLKVLAKKAVK
jgi:NADH-quinone oxidoreductase subunit G